MPEQVKVIRREALDVWSLRVRQCIQAAVVEVVVWRRWEGSRVIAPYCVPRVRWGKGRHGRNSARVTEVG